MAEKSGLSSLADRFFRRKGAVPAEAAVAERRLEASLFQINEVATAQGHEEILNPEEVSKGKDPQRLVREDEVVVTFTGTPTQFAEFIRDCQSDPLIEGISDNPGYMEVQGQPVLRTGVQIIRNLIPDVQQKDPGEVLSPPDPESAHLRAEVIGAVTSSDDTGEINTTVSIMFPVKASGRANYATIMDTHLRGTYSTAEIIRDLSPQKGLFLDAKARGALIDAAYYQTEADTRLREGDTTTLFFEVQYREPSLDQRPRIHELQKISVHGPEQDQMFKDLTSQIVVPSKLVSPVNKT